MTSESEADVDDLLSSPSSSKASSLSGDSTDEENSAYEQDTNSEADENSEDEELPEVEGGNMDDVAQVYVEEGKGSKSDTNNNKSSSSKAPHWNGERLYPPARVSKAPSKAWKYGGFRKNKRGELVTNVTVCGLCGKEIRYKNTPTHLSQHLSTFHENELAKEDEETTDQPRLDFYVNKTNAQPPDKYKPAHPKQKQFRKTLVEWIIDSNRPFKAVEDDKLVDAFKIADPKLKVPTARQICLDIEKLEKEKKESVKESFKHETYFSCSSDAGSSLDGRSFIDVNVHWVSEDFVPKKKILTVAEITES